MKKNLLILNVIFILFSCNNEGTEVSQDIELRNQEIERLNQEKITLEQNLSDRDKKLDFFTKEKNY